MMPHMDGYEVAQRIRNHQNPTIANVPIIILTAKGETEDKLRGFEAGADDYITKPFGPQELLARVRAKIRRVEVDSSLSPLTRLPGNLAIEAELRRRIEDERAVRRALPRSRQLQSVQRRLRLHARRRSDSTRRARHGRRRAPPRNAQRFRRPYRRRRLHRRDA